MKNFRDIFQAKLPTSALTKYSLVSKSWRQASVKAIFSREDKDARLKQREWLFYWAQHGAIFLTDNKQSCHYFIVPMLQGLLKRVRDASYHASPDHLAGIHLCLAIYSHQQADVFRRHLGLVRIYSAENPLIWEIVHSILHSTIGFKVDSIFQVTNGWQSAHVSECGSFRRLCLGSDQELIQALSYHARNAPNFSEIVALIKLAPGRDRILKLLSRLYGSPEKLLQQYGQDHDLPYMVPLLIEFNQEKALEVAKAFLSTLPLGADDVENTCYVVIDFLVCERLLTLLDSRVLYTVFQRLTNSLYARDNVSVCVNAEAVVRLLSCLLDRGTSARQLIATVISATNASCLYAREVRDQDMFHYLRPMDFIFYRVPNLVSIVSPHFSASPMKGSVEDQAQAFIDSYTRPFANKTLAEVTQLFHSLTAVMLTDAFSGAMLGPLYDDMVSLTREADLPSSFGEWVVSKLEPEHIEDIVGFINRRLQHDDLIPDDFLKLKLLLPLLTDSQRRETFASVTTRVNEFPEGILSLLLDYRQLAVTQSFKLHLADVFLQSVDLIESTGRHELQADSNAMNELSTKICLFAGEFLRDFHRVSGDEETMAKVDKTKRDVFSLCFGPRLFFSRQPGWKYILYHNFTDKFQFLSEKQQQVFLLELHLMVKRSELPDAKQMFFQLVAKIAPFVDGETFDALHARVNEINGVSAQAGLLSRLTPW